MALASLAAGAVGLAVVACTLGTLPTFAMLLSWWCLT